MAAKKVPSDIVVDPYVDYDALLSPDFTASKHANALVLSTNDPSDKQTDFTSPMQRIRYDLEEVNRRIDALVRNSVTAVMLG
jgi:Conserved oligomeric Golgi complex subunit 5, N-terminal